jgi:DNA invertase Pin-like site-specific DNA recombinase
MGRYTQRRAENSTVGDSMTDTNSQGRNIGYARVSKEEQNLSLQLDALKKYGVIRVFTDKQTGTRFDRKEFLAALAYLNDGDTLVVWKLDRLGRSLKELIETVENLQKRSIALVSLTEHIDTTTATGKLFLQFMAMLAEFERNLISERTKAGLAAARARGRVGGRKPIQTTDTKVVIAKQLHANNTPIPTILKTLNIKRSTFYRYLKM